MDKELEIKEIIFTDEQAKEIDEYRRFLRKNKNIEKEKWMEKLRIRKFENTKNIRKGELIKKPKLDLNIVEYKYLINLIDEINGCYYNSLFTALALISRKSIIVISKALAKKDNKEETTFKDNGAFDKYIAWLYDNHYLTNQQKSYLTRLKRDSNALHHTYDMETEKKDGEKYFKIIKGLIESNFETEEFNFKSDLVSEDFNLKFELDSDKD